VAHIDQPTIKAIETFYAGCCFRSRLEARWAVFFDHLDIEWQYELEGFELPDGTRYLPDFYMPEQDLWLEIKGDPGDDRGQEKFFKFAEHARAVMFVGNIPDPRQVEEYGPRGLCCGHFSGDHDYAWCVCPECGRFGIEFDARGARVCGGVGTYLGVTRGERCGRAVGDKSYSGNDPRILDAYAAARSARFEHGEKGATWR
jgi:hypothetical protein